MSVCHPLHLQSAIRVLPVSDSTTFYLFTQRTFSYKVNFLFLVCVCVWGGGGGGGNGGMGQFSLSYLTYVIIQASIFGSLDTQVSAFCILVPRPNPPPCSLLFVHHVLSTLVSEKRKKKAWWPGHF